MVWLIRFAYKYAFWQQHNELAWHFKRGKNPATRYIGTANNTNNFAIATCGFAPFVLASSFFFVALLQHRA